MASRPGRAVRCGRRTALKLSDSGNRGQHGAPVAASCRLWYLLARSSAASRRLRSDMRILATGVAGFIGSRVAELLAEQGHQVCGVDNMCAAYDVQAQGVPPGASARQSPVSTSAWATSPTTPPSRPSGRSAVPSTPWSTWPRARVCARASKTPGCTSPPTSRALSTCSSSAAETAWASSCWPPPPASTGGPTRCRSAKTPTPTGRCRPTPPRRRAPRPCATPTTTCTGST